ncbi:MAG TPA: alpha/beta fold hydrolase [Solirubrobacterales bacterium]
MASFVLIHGSWHGAWCWFKVEARLRERGHEVIVPDLPAHGRDRTLPGEVTLEDCVERIVEAMSSAAEPVTLVAHSRGGIPVTAAAEARPDLIGGLVYLAAFLPRSGENVLDLFPKDTDSLLPPSLDADFDAGWDMLRQEAFEPALYHDCPAQDVALATALLTPEPLAPSLAPIVTTERFAALPRAYIELTEDRAVTPAFQRYMHSRTPCDPVLCIAASHSAYFSKPDELADRLEELANALPR